MDALKKPRYERVIILQDAKMDYAPSQIDKFINLWNDGYSLDWITKKMGNIAKYEIALLTIHCEIEGLIKPRLGGIHGTIKKLRKKKEKIIIETDKPKKVSKPVKKDFVFCEPCNGSGNQYGDLPEFVACEVCEGKGFC